MYADGEYISQSNPLFALDKICLQFWGQHKQNAFNRDQNRGVKSPNNIFKLSSVFIFNIVNPAHKL